MIKKSKKVEKNAVKLLIKISVFYILISLSLKDFGPLAQLVEQQTLNLWVAGSIPAWLIKASSQTLGAFF